MQQSVQFRLVFVGVLESKSVVYRMYKACKNGIEVPVVSDIDIDRSHHRDYILSVLKDNIKDTTMICQVMYLDYEETLCVTCIEKPVISYGLNNKPVLVSQTVSECKTGEYIESEIFWCPICLTQMKPLRPEDCITHIACPRCGYNLEVEIPELCYPDEDIF